jgi:hypothetical protein
LRIENYELRIREKINCSLSIAIKILSVFKLKVKNIMIGNRIVMAYGKRD